ncbi:MAG: glycoside hydrolase family 26 protein [Chitinophagaceae bacterium]
MKIVQPIRGLSLFGLTMLCINLNAQLIDNDATAETKALHQYLAKQMGKSVLFGHQHATEYGHGWSGSEDRSDIKSVTGSHPAVVGVDIMGLSGAPDGQIRYNFNLLQKTIQDTYNRGGITTVAWHFSNPLSAGGFYWKDSVSVPAVGLMLPGSSGHEQYKSILKQVALLFHSVVGKKGEMVPLIFRPYHEMDGDWFWWGRSHSRASEFVQLWRFTVSYLRDSLQVHNLIYAFSPDCLFQTKDQYLERYPGDEWVDMVGMDNYADMGRDGSYDTAAAIRKLQIVSSLAKERKKLAAFTETGLESIPNPNWWTSILLKVLQAPGVHMSYVLVWRNDRDSPTHYYAPFPGQLSVPDFLKFYQHPYTLFERDLKGVYKTP